MELGASKDEETEDKGLVDEILLLNHDYSCDRLMLHECIRVDLVEYSDV